MSNSIASVSQLVTVIRSELGKVAGPVATTVVQGASKQPQNKRYAEGKLPGLIETRIREIGRDDPQRGRKAFRVFLEVVLLASFGERMVADPKFHQMIDDVQHAMESQPACASLVDQAIAQLLAQQG